MRPWAAGVGLLLLHVSASADETHVAAAGLVGVGAFGQRPATTLDAGLDIQRGEIAVGLGGRVRLLAGEGFRMADWDEPSEGARILRYATIAHPAMHAGDVAWSLALGPLSGVRLGHGAIVSGYTSGLDVDHGHTGMNARVVTEDQELEGLIDDVTRPGLVAARGAWRLAKGLRLGVTGAMDVAAPDMGGTREPFGVLGVEAEWATATPRSGLGGGLTADIADAHGVGGGLNAGAFGFLAHGGQRVVELGAELRVGEGGYLPGWFSPLYEVSRRRFGLERASPGETQLAVASSHGLGGVGGRAELALLAPRLGTLALSYEVRAGTRDLIVAKLALPASRRLQVGAWAAVERRLPGEAGPPFAGILACEARIRLPSALFVSAELARLYQDRDGAPWPVWIGDVAVGAVFGD